MDAKKALYRAKLKESAQKRDKRIDSPLVRYNENDQPICRVCDVVLKSESLWAAHQASRKHHEAITKFKANAAAQARNSANTEPPKELVHRTRPASALPADFFDKNETKKQKTGSLGSDGRIESDTINGSVKSLDSLPTEEAIASKSQLDEQYSAHAVSVKGNRESTPFKHPSHTTQKSTNSGAGGALPEGFFDTKAAEATRKMGVSEVKQVKGILPEGFFDKKDAETTRNIDDSEVKQVNGSLPEGFFDNKDANTNRTLGDSEVKQVKGALPEGFFDNKDADLRARGIQPVKVDINNLQSRRNILWNDLRRIHKPNSAWCLLGDFNCVLAANERIGEPVHPRDIMEFKDCLLDCGVFDLNFSGFFYTWTNNSEGVLRKFSKIDRCLVNIKWQSTFPGTSAEFLPQDAIPSTKAMLLQIMVAMKAMPWYTALPTLSEYMNENGWTRCYARISDVSWPAYFVYLAIYLVFVEFGIYWMHRELHDIKPLYKHLHATHHIYNKENTLSPFAGLAFHPLDGILQAMPHVIALFIIPTHFTTHIALLFIEAIWTANIHDCIHGKLWPVMGAGYHTIHHTTYRHNYGHYTIWMDWMFGTLRDPVSDEAKLS